jgi:hypothetical protein
MIKFCLIRIKRGSSYLTCGVWSQRSRIFKSVLKETEDEPIPVEIQTLLATSPQIIQHNLRKFTPKSANLDEHEITEKPKTKAQRIAEMQVKPSISDLSLQVDEDESTVVSKSVDLTSEAPPNLMKFVTNSFDIGKHCLVNMFYFAKNG